MIVNRFTRPVTFASQSASGEGASGRTRVQPLRLELSDGVIHQLQAVADAVPGLQTDLTPAMQEAGINYVPNQAR